MKNMMMAALLLLSSTAAMAAGDYGLQCIENKSIIHHPSIGPIALTASGGFGDKNDLKTFVGEKISINNAMSLKARSNIPSLQVITTVQNVLDIGNNQVAVRVSVLSYKNVWMICKVAQRTGSL